jgi:AcrR family transcriptional regulator
MMEIMKKINDNILENVAQIIMSSGLETLTIHNLATALNINDKQLYTQFTKVDDILLMILISFEKEIKEFIQELNNNRINPEEDIKLIFKRLFSLFRQKPYYLEIIFDKSMKSRDISVRNSVVRIKEIAENYLTGLINAGKMDHTFKTKISTKLLVEKMLFEFRLLMKDEHRINEMILEFKKIKN